MFHARRRCALTVLAAIAVAGCGSPAQDRPPDLPAGPPPWPTVPPAPPMRAVSSPGCHWLGDGPPPAALQRPAVKPPERPVPFFAERAGALPPTGTPTVGGVPLPRGSRCVRQWATDEPVLDAVGLASRLAAVFPQTGLWPVLWGAGDDPDSYMYATGDPHAADRLNAGGVLRTAWTDYVVEKYRFPGLAHGSAGAGTGAVAGDPFGTFARAWPSGLLPEGGWVLLLVPCNRPADVASVLGSETTEVMGDNARTAVLRSWEERFGTVLTAIAPDGLSLVVDAPPRTNDQALRLAGEHLAFAPEADEVSAGPEGLGDIARELRTGEPHYWEFYWPD